MKLLAFLASPYGLLVKVAAAVAILAGAYAFVFHQGVQHEKLAQVTREFKARQLAHKDIDKRETKTEAAVDEVKAGLGEERVRIQYVTRTITKEIPVAYVTPASDDRYLVPFGFVRGFNDAVDREASLPGSAGGPDDAPSGIPLSSVLETSVANTGTCYGWRAEAEAWRTWYPRVKAIYDAPR